MVHTIVLLCSMANPPISEAPRLDRFWWVFIERTKLQVQLSQTESQEMMKGHLGNFGRLFGIDKLRVAGPLRDTGGTKRGIAVLTVKGRDEVDESFKPDPFYQRGIFSSAVVPMKADFGDILKQSKEDEDKIEENRLVVFEQAKESSNGRSSSGRDAIRNGAAAGLAFHCTATSKHTIREIAIFRGTNDAAISAWLAADPLVKSGALKATVYPQFLGKGTLPTEPQPFPSRKPFGNLDD